MSNTASGYYEKVQSNRVVKMVVSRTDDVLSFSELVAELALPTDGSSEEDMKEIETAEQDSEKGALVRTRNLTCRLTRRGKRKLMSYKPVKFTVNVVRHDVGRCSLCKGD